MPKYINQEYIPDYQMRVQYGTTGNAEGRQEYLGYADPVKKETDAAWQIFKLTYNSSKQVIKRTYANGRGNLEHKWSSLASLDFA